MVSEPRPPVHESLHVVDSSDIYRNDDWWKAVVRYKFDRTDEYDETAVYMWNNDDGWTRKNKYVIKTTDAWETDKVVVNRLFSEPSSLPSEDTLPVSDYYKIAAGETIFRSDDWWKAIVKISEKGSYETDEVMIYLWQEVDGDWRRRQKYTIKSEGRWQEEADVVESVLYTDTQRDEDVSLTSRDDSDIQRDGDISQTSEDEPDTQTDEFKQLSREIDKHLSEESLE
jgi:hypothetical protein